MYRNLDELFNQSEAIDEHLQFRTSKFSQQVQASPQNSNEAENNKGSNENFDMILSASSDNKNSTCQPSLNEWNLDWLI